MIDEEFAEVGSNIASYTLTDSELAGIGRLVRACAEIEDIVHLYLCRLARIGPGQALMLLGRTGITQKLGIARQLAKDKGEEALILHKDCFEAREFFRVLDARNTLAHGIFLGMTDEGRLAFQVSKVLGSDENNVHVTVTSFDPEGPAAFAMIAESAIGRLEGVLGLKAERDRLRNVPLEPHRRSESQKSASKT